MKPTLLSLLLLCSCSKTQSQISIPLLVISNAVPIAPTTQDFLGWNYSKLISKFPQCKAPAPGFSVVCDQYGNFRYTFPWGAVSRFNEDSREAAIMWTWLQVAVANEKQGGVDTVPKEPSIWKECDQ